MLALVDCVVLSKPPPPAPPRALDIPLGDLLVIHMDIVDGITYTVQRAMNQPSPLEP